MKKLSEILSAALISIGLLATISAHAGGVTPVTTGAVIRGVTLPLPVGVPGTSTAKMCDFSGEEVNQAGKMTGASVNCSPGGSAPHVLFGLPARFNAYCVVDSAKNVKGARILAAPIPGDANHCDLSGISPKNATGQFKGAVWR